MQQHVLVTGGTGLVGYGLVKILIEQGLRPVLLIRASSNLNKFKPFGDKVTFISTDFFDQEKLLQTAILIGKQYPLYATVYALGATEAPNTDTYNRVNAYLLHSFIRIFKEAGVDLGRLIFVSSLGLHGARKKGEPAIKTDSPFYPLSDYARSKILAEQLLKECHDNFVIVRPAAVFGAFDRQMAIVYRIVSMGIHVYFGSKQNTFGVIHSEDLANHILACIRTPVPAGSVYISCTHNVSVDEYLSAISKAYQKTSKLSIPIPKFMMFAIAFCNEWIHRILASKSTPVLNLQKAREITAENWTCDTSGFYQLVKQSSGAEILQQRIQQTAKWYQENHWMS